MTARPPRRADPMRAPANAGRIRRVLASGAQAIALALTVLVLWQAWQGLDAPLTVVRVSGELTAGERDRATELVSSFLPAGFLAFDAAGLRKRLEAESWVDGASVKRLWPAILEVRVVPEVAVARWRDDALLSGRGRVIEPLELVGVDALPRLRGPDGSAQQVMEVFQMVGELLRPTGLAVIEIEQDAVGNVRIVTRDGPTILLGADEHAGRLLRVAAVLEHGLADRLPDVARLDARYDNGIAVAWRDPGADVASTAQLASSSIRGARDAWPLQLHR
ncbi:MAG TPA: cell division protein FtsQ/DivIB [Pseudomonadales bacterium]|nr:cell division protein FtsQ/DivIB [Pseudomonadales bacterium]